MSNSLINQTTVYRRCDNCIDYDYGDSIRTPHYVEFFIEYKTCLWLGIAVYKFSTKFTCTECGMLSRTHRYGITSAHKLIAKYQQMRVDTVRDGNKHDKEVI